MTKIKYNPVIPVGINKTTDITLGDFRRDRFI